MHVTFTGVRALLSSIALPLMLAACGGASSDGPTGPPALTNTIIFVSDRT